MALVFEGTWNGKNISEFTTYPNTNIPGHQPQKLEAVWRSIIKIHSVFGPSWCEPKRTLNLRREPFPVKTLWEEGKERVNSRTRLWSRCKTSVRFSGKQFRLSKNSWIGSHRYSPPRTASTTSWKSFSTFTPQWTRKYDNFWRMLWLRYLDDAAALVIVQFLLLFGRKSSSLRGYVLRK